MFTATCHVLERCRQQPSTEDMNAYDRSLISNTCLMSKTTCELASGFSEH